MPPKDIVQPRRGTAAEWAAKTPSPVLKLGELGVETDTHRMKIGDGVTAWSSLGYIAGTFDLENVPVQQLRDTDANLSALTTPFLSGQFVYGQTTGKTVIGDGESLFDELPDLRKQFKNVITVCKDGPKGSADFICSDSKYANDSACIQAALNSAPTNSIIVIFSGTYVLPTLLSQQNKNIYILGYGKVIFSYTSSPAEGQYGIFLYGAGVAERTVTVDANTGDTTITISSTSSIQPGDLIKIYNNVIWSSVGYPDQVIGEIYEVKSISGQIVTLTEPLIHDYKTSTESKILFYHPIEVHINNIEIKHVSSTQMHSGIGLMAVKNSSVSNCKISNAGRSSISAYYSYNIHVFKNTISNSLVPGAGYGVGVWSGTAHMKIYNNYINNCRHCITHNTDSRNVLTRSSMICNNTLVGAGNIDGSSNVIDAHPIAINTTVLNNEIFVKYGFFAFWDGTQQSRFSNNIIHGGYGAVYRRAGIEGGSYVISDNTIDGSNNSYIYRSDNSGIGVLLCIEHNTQINGRSMILSSEAFQNIIIVGNTTLNIINPAIQLGISTNMQFLKISDNNILNSQYGGIYIYNNNSNTIDMVNILNNTILNPNHLGSQNVGIHIENTNGATIAYNNINDTIGCESPAILLDSCNDTTIYKNNLIGMQGDKIQATGTNNTIQNNIGYTTESTGTATITASQTSATISHGLVTAPTRINVTPFGNVGSCWIDPASITSTQMTIHCSTAPEADTAVSWSAQVV